jgi:hypothetical protein
MPRTPDFKNNKSLSDLLGAADKPHALPETGWWHVGNISEGHGIDFQNSWVNIGSSSVPASWYLDENGEVKLRGHVSGGSANTVIFTLPEEVRPEYIETYIIALEDDGSIHLEGIHFRAFEGN